MTFKKKEFNWEIRAEINDHQPQSHYTKNTMATVDFEKKKNTKKKEKHLKKKGKTKKKTDQTVPTPPTAAIVRFDGQVDGKKRITHDGRR